MADTKPAKKVMNTSDKSPVKPVVVEKEPAPMNNKSKRWSVDSLFWGLLLVVIGGLLLLGNLGVLAINWFELWRLWPLFIVAAGFSVLSTNHWLWKLVSVLFVVGALGVVVLVALGGYDSDSSQVERHQTSIQLKDEVQQAEVHLSAGASRLTINSADTTELVVAKLGGRGLKLEENSRVENRTQYIDLSSERDRAWWMGHHNNTWDVTLSERLPLKLSVDAGASSTNADLSKLNLSSLKLEAGASSTEITLGNKATLTKVTVEAGASSFTVRVPKDSGVSLKFDGGLSSTDLSDLKETGKGEYASDNYDTATKKIDIVVDAGLTSFTIERY